MVLTASEIAILVDTLYGSLMIEGQEGILFRYTQEARRDVMMKLSRVAQKINIPIETKETP